MFPNQTLGKNIYIYTSDPGERRDGAACGPGNIRLSCSQKGDSAGNTQPGSHLGEMRTEAEECESSPCVPEALKLFRAGAPCLSADLSVCLSVRGDSILEGAGSVWWGGWDSASSSSCVWLLFQLRNFFFFFNF